MRKPATKRPVATWKKIAVTGGILLGVGAIVSGGAFAVFTSTGTASLAASAGSLKIMTSGTYTISGIASGDQLQRLLPITLPATGNVGELISSVNFSYGLTPSTSSTTNTSDVFGTADPALNADGGQSLVSGLHGLTYRLLTCSVPWTAVTTPTVSTGAYSCSGTLTTVASGKLSAISSANPVSLLPSNFGTSVTPTATGTFPTGTRDLVLNTLIELDLPTAADNNYENASTSLVFSADAVQRAGIQK